MYVKNIIIHYARKIIQYPLFTCSFCLTVTISAPCSRTQEADLMAYLYTIPLMLNDKLEQ